MAEHKACADLVAITGDSVANSSQHAGECVFHSSPNSGVDDSGTESGEDFRLLSPEILAEVQNALTRLESALPGLDPVRREALVRLVTRLQTCLKLQPPPSAPPAQPPPTPPNPPPPQPPVKRYANRNKRQRHLRHTVGVSKEELADARRWLLETGQQTEASSKVPSEDQYVEIQSSTNLTNLQEEKAVSQVFRPVKFNPNQTRVSDYELSHEVSTNEPEPFDTSGDTEESPVVLSAALTYTFPCEVPKVDSGSSLLEYDPSLVLFTPAQSVQIAVHKAAINKQITEEENKRESSKREESYESDDGDISSVDEEQNLGRGQEGLEDAISSAQRLLQIATDNKKTHGRFQDRSSKKQKMKRANTIDIPKPMNYYERENSSPEEFEMSADDMNKDKYLKNKAMNNKKMSQPPFQPKTENDLKFLAFLRQANKNEVKAVTYNPSARGGPPWTNRFTNIKTAFEATPETKQDPQIKSSLPALAQNWEKNANKAVDSSVLRQAVHNRTPQPLQNKLPWSSKQEDEGVVIGLLTVKTTPGPVNKFFHAPKSAFKPIEKKPINQPQKLHTQQQNKKSIQTQPKSVKKNNQDFHKGKISENKNSQPMINNKVTTSVTGTVKQLATQKFSGENIPSKPIIKQYPAIQDKQFNAANSVKQHPFVEQISKPSSTSVSTNHLPPPQQFSTSIASAHRQFTSQPDSENVKMIKIPQKTQTNDYKDGSEYSPPKQYINSPPLSKNYSEPFDYPVKHKVGSALSTVSNHKLKPEVQETLTDPNPVTYYSQEPAYVQHSTYTQPHVNYSQQSALHSKLPLQQYPSLSESVEECPATYAQQYNSSFTHPEGKIYKNETANQCINESISLVKSQKKTSQKPISYSEPGKEEPHHRFTEKSLVPNPLVLGQVYKPVCKPAEHLTYESAPMVVPLYEPPQVVFTVKPTFPSISNNLYENNSSQGSLSSSKLSDSSSSIKQYLNIPYDYGHEISPVISNTSKSPYFDESVNSSGLPSPHWNHEDEEDNEISLSEGAEMHTAVSKVMGHAQCQKAVTVSNRTQHRYDDDRSEPESLLRTLLRSPHSPTNMARKQSLEKIPVFTEPRQSSKSPLLDKPTKNKLLPETYLYPVVTKPPTITTPQNDRVQNVQNKPISSAASAFRPLVNNLSKPPESDLNKRPPIPSSPPTYGKKLESDNRHIQTSTNISSSSSNKFYEPELLPKPHLSVSPSRAPPSTSPSFPNVLQKSESWHQLVKEQMGQGRHPPPKSPRLSKTKSSHTLAFPKQFEAHLTPDTLAVKQSTVDQYLKSSKKQSTKTTKQMSKQKKTVSLVKLDENLENVDEAFETLFQEVAKRK